ncbi:hypothetical protein EYZ11_007754 [Aspergillus tanneri]|uniref:Zn(2)-C6 fungal-type domain-containing protein n=1 Tax=Aspergillus tanneri TaxID=1220188 RepID=A0A4S3JCG7_9EURO|nr:uncharacterized protein ATNIH1004_002122 [Aspergillus tanneri]KAA8649451.1 hypothetical protein ATNIH1004_002122 [Aspergillus tanneri]THC92762.1 hypothetical protein EYZ11_007754 [Aspergillus tanneri]
MKFTSTLMDPASTSSATSTPTSAATSPVSSSLRRSCIFCRARKIRCSGGHICSACRERNINCVYGPEARKGRPRRKQPSADRPLRVPPPRTSDVDSSPAPLRRNQSPHERGGSPGSQHTLGQDLEQMFNEYFIHRSGSRSNLFQNSIASFQREMDRPSSTRASAECPRRLTYDGLLSFLAHDMVEMLLRFSNLGCEQPQGTNRHFYITSLAADTTQTMFDPPQPMKKPLSTLGKYRLLQMVDLWFSMHPLSPLISKTLLISEIKDETVDPALLAIMLADACQVHHGGANGQAAMDQEDPQILAQFAANQLRQRVLSLTDPDPLSTAQALIFMGWRELCQGNARRGTCYVGYTCRIVSRLHKMWAEGNQMEVDGIKLNGINITKVKKEILQNIYWLCLSTTTWSFMQIQQPFSLLLPDEIPDFPSMDESSSPILRLDQASDNISTLQAQIRTMQWLWPLSHITSTVAHVYTLFLNATRDDETPRCEIAPWQTQHIHELQQLPQACFDPSVLSRHIRRILLQAIQAVEREVTNVASQSFLLAAYHTIVIHMLFSQPKRSTDTVLLTSSTIRTFAQSASALLTIARRSPPQPTSPVPLPRVMGHGSTDGVRTLALGLDTCSRALVQIHSQSDRWRRDSDEPTAMLHAQLAEYVQAMHQVCKADSLMQRGSVIRPVKKRLKQLKHSFSSQWSATPVVSTHSSPTDQTSVHHPSSSPREPSRHPVHLDAAAGLPFSHLAPSPSPALSDRAPESLDSYFYLGEPDLGSLLALSGFAKPSSGARPSVPPSRSSTSECSLPSHPSSLPPSHHQGADSLLLAAQLSVHDRHNVGVDALPEPYDATFAPRSHPIQPRRSQGSPDPPVSTTSEADVATLRYGGAVGIASPWAVPPSWLDPFGSAAGGETEGLFRT